MENTIKISCIKVIQPIGEFYIGTMKWSDLISITRRDLERIRSNENDGSYFGIQRGLSPNRLKEISQYVSFGDATFPTSIVLSINTMQYNDRNEEFDNNIVQYEDGILQIKCSEKVAKIIDGQHRVFGLEKYVQDNSLFTQQSNFDFDFIVTIFIDLDEEYESNIFATINKAQTRVNSSLVYDLYDLAKTRSPQRSAHNIVKLLNEDVNSPFYKKIKRLGYSESGIETIAQATLVECILKYISSNPSLDRDSLTKGKKLQKPTYSESKKLFLRNYFIENQDLVITKFIWNYFSAVKSKWPSAWNDKTKIISKSTGVIALMRFLKDVVNSSEVEDITSIDFVTVFQRIKIDDSELINDRFKSGGVGQTDLYKEFCKYLII